MKLDWSIWGRNWDEDSFGNKLPKRTKEEEEASTAWVVAYNKLEAVIARRLKLSLRYKLLDRKKLS